MKLTIEDSVNKVPAEDPVFPVTDDESNDGGDSSRDGDSR